MQSRLPFAQKADMDFFEIFDEVVDTKKKIEELYEKNNNLESDLREVLCDICRDAIKSSGDMSIQKMNGWTVGGNIGINHNDLSFSVSHTINIDGKNYVQLSFSSLDSNHGSGRYLYFEFESNNNKPKLEWEYTVGEEEPSYRFNPQQSMNNGRKELDSGKIEMVDSKLVELLRTHVEHCFADLIGPNS